MRKTTFYHRCLFVSTSALSSTVSPTAVSLQNSNLTTFNNSSNSSAIHVECRKPGSYVPDNVLATLWRIVYWTSQVLTWLVLPMMQSYSNAGDFTPWRRLKTAAYANVIYYGICVLVLGFLLVYVAIKGFVFSFENLKVVCVTASNTWGLLLLVLLLGYGLVEVPRQFWQMGSKGYRLQKIYFEIEKLSTDRNDAEEAVKEAYDDVQELTQSIGQQHPYRGHLMTIISKFPHDLVNRLQENMKSSSSRNLRESDVVNLGDTTENSLVRLHRRVISSVQAYRRVSAQWAAMISQALHLEDVAKNDTISGATKREFRRTSRDDRSIWAQAICVPTLGDFN